MGKKLSLEEINEIAIEYINLNKTDTTKFSSSEKFKFEMQRNNQIQKLFFMIISRTHRYKFFNNFSDLKQCGYEALVKALNTYDTNRGPFFSWWAHKYINTKIKRAANTHSLVRVPLDKAAAEATIPISLQNAPSLIEEKDPYYLLNNCEIEKKLNNAVNLLDSNRKKIIEMIFGINGIDTYNLTMTARKLNISRPKVERILKNTIRELSILFETD